MDTTPRGIHIPDANPEDRAPQLRQMALDIDALFTEGVLPADVTNATNVMAPLNDLVREVENGKSYRFTLVLKVFDSALEGIAIDFNGGTATVSDFWASAIGWAEMELGMAKHTTALNVSMSYDSIAGSHALIMIEGYLTASADGTFKPRFAQKAHAAGSITVKKGSTIEPLREVV